MEDEAEKENRKEEKDLDLTTHEHERALKEAYRSFVLPGKLRTDKGSYLDQTKPLIETFITNQRKEFESAKIIMTLSIIWKIPIIPLIELDPEDEKIAAQELDDAARTGDNYMGVEMPFNSIMTKFFHGSGNNDLIECMLAYIRVQNENLKFPESGFTLDKIMHPYTSFHRLALTRGSSCNELPELIKNKKAVINPENKDGECFKQGVIAPLHYEEIKNNPERISLLRSYEKQYNWKGLEFPGSIKKIDKFEENNSGIAVNVLFSNKKSPQVRT